MIYIIGESEKGHRAHGLKGAHSTVKIETMASWAWPTQREACPARPKEDETPPEVAKWAIHQLVNSLESLLARGH